jgi:hypothetical protein
MGDSLDQLAYIINLMAAKEQQACSGAEPLIGSAGPWPAIWYIYIYNQYIVEAWWC